MITKHHFGTRARLTSSTDVGITPLTGILSGTPEHQNEPLLPERRNVIGEKFTKRRIVLISGSRRQADADAGPHARVGRQIFVSSWWRRTSKFGKIHWTKFCRNIDGRGPQGNVPSTGLSLASVLWNWAFLTGPFAADLLPSSFRYS